MRSEVWSAVTNPPMSAPRSGKKTLPFVALCAEATSSIEGAVGLKTKRRRNPEPNVYRAWRPWNMAVPPTTSTMVPFTDDELEESVCRKSDARLHAPPCVAQRAWRMPAIWSGDEALIAWSVQAGSRCPSPIVTPSPLSVPFVGVLSVHFTRRAAKHPVQLEEVRTASAASSSSMVMEGGRPSMSTVSVAPPSSLMTLGKVDAV
mmetsp:Transcript_9890/g.23077  ORF Transcript_9890/g.23077 Transcript_9890/m.23077 type:complete len:204 (+) Transcript_9890:2274-2885(+)